MKTIIITMFSKNKNRLPNCQSNTNTKQKHCYHCLNPFQLEKAYKNHLEKDVWHQKDNKQRCQIKTLI